MGYVVICINWTRDAYVQVNPESYKTRREAQDVADAIEEKWEPLVVPEHLVDMAIDLNTKRILKTES